MNIDFDIDVNTTAIDIGNDNLGDNTEAKDPINDRIKDKSYNL